MAQPKKGLLVLFFLLCGIVCLLVWFNSEGEICFMPNSAFAARWTLCNETCPSCQQEWKDSESGSEERKLKHLIQLWSNSSYLEQGNESEAAAGIPRPPHLELCKQLTLDRKKWDTGNEAGHFPKWTQWRGLLGLELDPLQEEEQGLFPPWIKGADEDNLPLTRRVQRDLWLHQHPKNCSDPSVKFLVAGFATAPGYGVGAQLTGISGALAIAINENRVLVLDYYNRADHEGCIGPDHARWTCYFFPETSGECRERAKQLAEAGSDLVVDIKSYNGGEFYTAYPGNWGSPWERSQPTSQVDEKLVIRHNMLQQYWWRSQVIRYLMRFPSEYLCTQLNRARHYAFGEQAAKMVLKTLPKDWPEEPAPSHNITEMERMVWSNHVYRPWIPRPMVSIHVRQGDKAGEMQLFPFQSYMKRARYVRNRFPEAENVWLSSEMENIIEEAKSYSDWNFYYTNITRQTGTTSMYEYERSLGNMKAVTNSFVNLFMAAECDFFVGVLGSTWDTVIEGLRRTSGKTYAGMLSVNPGMHW